MTGKRQIDCIIFSTGRSASTALYRYLDLAGNLSLPSQKEPHYWCDIPSQTGLYDLIWQIYVGDEESYWRLYSESKISLDASCAYFFYLDDVIAKLKKRTRSPEKTKVVFLYREPVSRALSWYNERKKKHLTDAENVLCDMMSVPAPGLWWEHYYDNVMYDAGFSKLQQNFDDILAVNYDYFALQPRAVVAELLGFLGLEPSSLDLLTFDPVNSSQEALVRSGVARLPFSRSVGRRLPPSFKKWISSQLIRTYGLRLKKKQRAKYAGAIDIKSSLQISLAEYERFRDRIGHQDLYKNF